MPFTTSYPSSEIAANGQTARGQTAHGQTARGSTEASLLHRLRFRRTVLVLATAGVLASSFAINTNAFARGFQATPPGSSNVGTIDDSERRGLDASGIVSPPDPFAEGAPMPVMPTGESDPEGTVNYDAAADTVEIHVSGANIVDVLRMLATQSERNIIASKQVSGQVTCNLYDVTVAEALSAILRSNGLASREEGRFIYVYTQDELREMDEANRRPETRVFRLYHTSPVMAAKMVEPALTETALVSFSDDPIGGVGSSPDDGGGYAFSSGDILVVRDYAEHLDEVERILDEVDARPEQVLIEATILSTTLTEDNQLGVDFNLIGGVDFSAVNFLNGGQPSSGTVASPAPLNGGEIYGGGTGSNFTSPVAGGLKLGFVSGDVSVFLSALEGVTDTTVLANPKVLALNKQKGEVLVGREDGYLTTTLTETSATQQVEFLKTGTSLVFRPFISRDGYVRLEIHPEDSAGGVDDRGLPSKVTTQVTSNVMVKDGHTIVIGGLFRESSSIGRSQIPILGNLPLVGALFRRQADATTREEIIILLTPHVVKDMDRYADLSEQELRRAEKLRVGTRQGMMPWGRERMAQSHYEKAISELAKDSPNRDRARLHLNAALHLNPTFIEAIELKEIVTREVVVEADQSTIRSFLRRAVREDAAGSTGRVNGEQPDIDPVVPQPRDRLEGEVRPSGRLRLTPPSPLPSTRPAAVPARRDDEDAPKMVSTPTPTTRPATRPSLAETDPTPMGQ